MIFSLWLLWSASGEQTAMALLLSYFPQLTEIWCETTAAQGSWAEEDVILTGQGLGVGRATRQVPRLRAALAGRRLELVICTQEIAKGATWIAMVDLECSGKFLDTPFWVFFPVCLKNSWHIKLIKNAEDKKGKRLWINKENFCQKTGWGEIPKAYI